MRHDPMSPSTQFRPGSTMVKAIEEAEGLDSVGRPLQQGLRRFFSPPARRRTKAFLNGSWLGHPLHPALTDLPIGAWTAASIFDIGGMLGYRRMDQAAMAAVGVGIVGAVGAAVTGLADWTDLDEGEKRRVGMVHANLNSIALGLQVASWVRRRRRMGTGRMLSFAGLGVTTFSAYLGGVLVYHMATGVRREAMEQQPSTQRWDGPQAGAPSH